MNCQNETLLLLIICYAIIKKKTKSSCTYRTNIRILTFVDILTVVGDSVSPLSGGTLAGERADGVDTSSALTEARDSCTFVYILKN